MRPRQAKHRQAWIRRLQGRQVEAPAIQRAGAEVLDQHVELRQQPQQKFAPARCAHVQRDAPLAAIGHFPVQRMRVGDRRQRAQRIAAVRQLELDDVGAQVGTQRRRLARPADEHRAGPEHRPDA